MAYNYIYTCLFQIIMKLIFACQRRQAVELYLCLFKDNSINNVIKNAYTLMPSWIHAIFYTVSRVLLAIISSVNCPFVQCKVIIVGKSLD